MANNYYTVLAIIEAKPGKEEELEKILKSLVAPTLQEEGCVNYDFHRDSNNPAIFMFYENWVNKDAHQKHCETTHIKEWQARMPDLVAKPYDVTFWDKL